MCRLKSFPLGRLRDGNGQLWRMRAAVIRSPVGRSDGQVGVDKSLYADGWPSSRYKYYVGANGDVDGLIHAVTVTVSLTLTSCQHELDGDKRLTLPGRDRLDGRPAHVQMTKNDTRPGDSRGRTLVCNRGS